MPKRILLVDDETIDRLGIVALLEGMDDVVITQATSVDDALAAARSARPDIVVCDIVFGNEARGLDFIERLHRDVPDAPPVFFLSSFTEPAFCVAAIERGAMGYFTKAEAVEQIRSALQRVLAGDRAFSPIVLAAAALAPRSPSTREIEIMVRIAHGRSNDEIAHELGISERTVESHLRRCFMRYGVLSRTELVLKAMAQGWLPRAIG